VKINEIFQALLDVLGLDFAAKAGEDDGLVDSLMNLLIDLRKQARADKNYALADQIRQQLGEIGIVLEDTKQGTTWKKE
jgi:cysteinyl-tRNA synthetase